MNINRCVAIEHFSGVEIAEAAASLLNSEGIETMIQSDGAGGEFPNLAFGGCVSLLIDPEDLELARGILNLTH